ncbi:aspartate aminotransferase family protein [Thermoplasmatales archaeon ex4484_36]|nr:MAG: aspartate aminotransferase family protein [Thermoplasmatales archaeon ex4484_36]
MDGNLYIDFTSGIGVLNTGFSHPEIVKAVKEQVEKLVHFAGTDFYYRVQVDLAEKLTQITPGDYEKKVFFTNSGTESVEAAIKLTRWSTQRKRFIAFLGAFHGRTMGSLSLTASKTVHRARFFPTMEGVTHIPYAYCYRCPYRQEYPSCGMYCAKILEELYFETAVPPEEVAAIFVEPVQGEGGYIVPPKEFIPELKRIAERHGILLVDDEVQAGFGRTGKFFAVEHYGVVPDVITTAKALGSGYPIGAIIFRKELDFGVQGAHSNTYGGNLVASTAALKTIEVIEKERLVERSRRLGELMRKRLMEMQEKHELIGDVRGLGLMQATELVKDRRTKEYAPKEREMVVEEALKRGLILLPAGRSAIRYIPPLVIEEEHLNAGLDVLDEAFSAVEKKL